MTLNKGEQWQTELMRLDGAAQNVYSPTKCPLTMFYEA